MRYAHIDIDQSALAHNLSTLNNFLSAPTKLLAMVKADAYGHHVPLVLDGLMAADGFGVATFAEGLQVYRHCQQKSQDKLIVLMEGVFSADEWQRAIKHHFAVLVHCQAQLDWALTNLPEPQSRSNTIWLKYNTGMNRLGFDKSTVIKAAKALYDKGYRLILTSHFACADDKHHPSNDAQICAFDDTLRQLKSSICPTIQGSLCNSAGIINFAHAHYDWVRAGIGLYGTSPVLDKTHDALALKPVMHFFAKIMAIHQLQAKEAVGYGALWRADKPSRIGVVSVGYGDGYPRVVQDAWVTLIKGNQHHRAPIVGRVAMDMLMVDLTHLMDAQIGDTVVLWGNSPCVAQIASCANTIAYELLCKTTKRPTRCHHNKLVKPSS